MLWKKSIDIKSVNDVAAANGKFSLFGYNFNVYSYFVDGILIDTGSKTLQRYFEHFFEKLTIDKVVITHHHEDHTGGAAFLQQNYNIPIYQSDEHIIDCRKEASYPFYRKIANGSREPYFAYPLDKTFTSKNATWDVIPTPGHANDHVVFLNRETGQLFTGDLYIQEKTKVALKDESIPMIIDSLKSVLAYDFDEVFCAHAGHLKNGRQALEKKLDYLINLEGEILQLHEQGLTAIEIRKKLLKNDYPVVRYSFGEFDALYIVTSILQGHDDIEPHEMKSTK